MVKVGCFIILFAIIGLVLFYLVSFIGVTVIVLLGFRGPADGLIILPFTALFSVATSLFITTKILKDDKVAPTSKDKS